MSLAELQLKAAVSDAMATLEKKLKNNGAGEWEAVILTYHPDVAEAYIAVLTDDATVMHAHDILDKLREEGL